MPTLEAKRKYDPFKIRRRVREDRETSEATGITAYETKSFTNEVDEWHP